MKMSEMTARQKKAFINIYHASNHLLGGLENTMSDNSPGTPEHENAKAMLADHDALVRELYSMATTAVYAEGLCGFVGGYADRQFACFQQVTEVLQTQLHYV